MSRILLISSNTSTTPYPVYPLGMATVAGALAARGHSVRQFDCLAASDAAADLTRELTGFQPEIVGVSLRNIDDLDSCSDGGSWCLDRVRELLLRIRGCCAVPVVVGGPAFSLMPERMLAYLGADYGIVGEGEAAFPSLVAALERGESPPPITRSEAFLDRRYFADPLHDRALVEYYLDRSGMLGLQSKRGCPHRCSYCSYNRLEGGILRARDSRAVAEEIRRLQRDFGVGTFFFTDAIFNDRDKLYLQLAEELLRQSLPIRWCAFFRPRNLPRQELALLKRAGLYALEFGTDAASDATLAGMCKDFDFAEVATINRDCIAEELPCAHYVIFGGPGETGESVEEGLANLEALGRCMVFAFSGIRLLPGTPLLRQACVEGVVTPDIDLLRPVYYFSPGVERTWMNQRIEQAFRGRRDRIFPPARGLAKLAVLKRFGQRGLLWDRLLATGQNAGATGRLLQPPVAAVS